MMLRSTNNPGLEVLMVTMMMVLTVVMISQQPSPLLVVVAAVATGEVKTDGVSEAGADAEATSLVHNIIVDIGSDSTSDPDLPKYGSTSNSTSGSGSSSSSGGIPPPPPEFYGWVSAFLAMLAFGTFGAPIKSKAAKQVNIDPLVMQTYKTSMCFITSWIFVLARGEEIAFTPWGVVSGLFWVPGGVATIYAIKSAGLAIGIGVGSSFIVLVSFYWGIFVFGEHVHSRVQACFAVGCMLCGLVGMAYYSSPAVAHASAENDTSAVGVGVSPGTAATSHREGCDQDGDVDVDENSRHHRREGSGFLRGLFTNASADSISAYDPVRGDDPVFLPPDMDEDQYVSFQDIRNGGFGRTGSDSSRRRNNMNRGNDDVMTSSTTNYVAMNDDDVESSTNNSNNNNTPHSTPMNIDVANNSLSDQNDDGDVDLQHQEAATQPGNESSPSSSSSPSSPPDVVYCCYGKVAIPRRTLGILVAVFSGVYGGSIMAPLKYAPPDCKGLGYLISFAVGASIITLTLWIVRFLVLCFGKCNGSATDAYNALPSFHFKTMWLYGGACGLIWSIGNFFSILSVEFLGEGVGYSVTQASILVSGLWGIFYFKEVEGTEAISKWMLSALVTVTGILLLSFEHHEK
eukprot:CAMPEP_0113492778 /NCGR_PEP_ID=MMETSP0014_2-20120614/28254_1 /TAXON_ID=2857 /ORGANISM="Nitzschia sp." /LENGTH=627 /DNA_ID=CAMNT_0000386625 /DNA_START=200 /DNA_END=2083 /DNA_ORIENTATION=+ /assembly_acc=CAM_ASM_000159